MRIKLTLIFAFALHTSCLLAQNAKTTVMSIDEVLKRTLEHNFDIRISKNNTQSSQNLATKGQAGLLPSVDVNAGFNYQNQNTYQEFAGNFGTNDVRGAQTYGGNGAIQVSYILFKGFHNRHQYHLLKNNVSTASLREQLQIEATFMNVYNVYYNIIALERALKTAGESVATSKLRLDRVKRQLEFGQATTIQVLNAQVDLNSDEASYQSTLKSLKQSKLNLSFLMGDSSYTDFQTDTIISGMDKEQLLKLKSAISNDNLELKLNNSQYYNYSYELKKAKSALFPTLSANASYGVSTNQAEAGVLLVQNTAGFTGGLTLSFNLFNGKRSQNAIDNNILALHSNQLEKEQLMSRLSTDFEAAFLDYDYSALLLEQQQSSVQLAHDAMELAKTRLELGQINNLEYRETQTNLLHAEQQLIQQAYNLKIAELKLLQISGQLVNF